MGDSRGRSRRAVRSPRSGSTCDTGARCARRRTSGRRGGRRSSNSWRCTRDDSHPRVPIPQGQVRGLRQRAGRLRPPLERRPVPGVRGDPREADGGEGCDPRRGPGGRGVKAGKRGEYEWPEEGELVVCTVNNVKNFGAFGTLDEYEGKEGFIHVAEVSSGWIKYIRDYVREGQKLVCKVLRVDREKGHIDLSLKAVNEHQKREKIQEWKNEQKAEKLLSIAAERLGKPVDALWQAGKDDHVNAKVQYTGAPRYRLVVRAPDYKSAEEEIQKAAARVLKHLEAKGGIGKFLRKE